MTNHLTYADPAIAAKQRATVTSQLAAMHLGIPPILFQVVGDLLAFASLHLPAPATLLDAGCGSAYYSEVIEHFIPDHYSYTGIDYNPGMVALAHELYPTLTVLRADLCILDFPDRSFDVVLSGACIAHIYDWQTALSELVRVTDSYLLLHRNPIYLDDSPTLRYTRHDYDTDVWVHRFDERDLLSGTSDSFDLVATRDLCPIVRNEVTRTYLFKRRR